MTLGDKIRDAIKRNDATAAGWAADLMRNMGLNYSQSFQVVQKAAPETELADWDALLYESDRLDSLGPAHQRIAFK